MDIRKFVSETINQVVGGVIDAQLNPDNTAADIAPGYSSAFRREQNIDFDIAVTVEQSSAADAEGRIQVFGTKVGGGGSLTSAETTASRVKFNVILRLPGSRKRT